MSEYYLILKFFLGWYLEVYGFRGVGGCYKFLKGRIFEDRYVRYGISFMGIGFSLYCCRW